MFSLDEIFRPGRNFSSPRRANQRHRGYLKSSIFSLDQWNNADAGKQSAREKSRRIRQIQAGIISADQVLRP